jgi:3-phosphoshikimate 1-carboxyvinyltransferase
VFRFAGPILASKSWLNRAQVLQYFNPQVKLNIDAESDDVVSLKNAITSIGKTSEFDLGLGGTSFRFFAFLISRTKGEFKIKAAPRLLQRPQSEILDILKQLGVSCELSSDHLSVKSAGWQKTHLVQCNGTESSQFVSGLLLSSWNLDFDLNIQIKKPVVSFDYLKMTISLLQQAGMQIKILEEDKFLQIAVAKMQKSNLLEMQTELDVSSAFSLCAAAVVAGQVQITNWSMRSSQPDMSFLAAFIKMQIHYEISNSNLKIAKHNTWFGIEADLQNSPDLFPVLAVLCALAKGESRLYGAEQLRHKESDRIAKTRELLQAAGFKCEELNDGLKIFGQSSVQSLQQEFSFDPDHDHRMAMAAALLKLKGYHINIQNPAVVNKSYPNFWKDIGL